MVCNRKCDGEVSSEQCAAIRIAYNYGFSVAEAKYMNEIKGFCTKVVNRMNELQEEQE